MPEYHMMISRNHLTHFLYLAFGHLHEPHGDPVRPSNAERLLEDMIVPTP